MTTLTMRLDQRRLHRHRARRRADEVQEPARGQGLVQGAPSRLADHRDRAERQARGTQETIRATEPVT